MTIFIICFILVLISYLFHTVSHYLEYRGNKLSPRKSLHSVFESMIFIGYISWGLMMVNDPVKINISSSLALTIGLVIGVPGLAILISSIIAKHGFSDADHLVTGGIYKRLRNPMYFGIILVHLGFPIASKSLITLISAVIWIPLILAWRFWEEKELEKRFGQKYLDYKKRTIF